MLGSGDTFICLPRREPQVWADPPIERHALDGHRREIALTQWPSGTVEGDA